MNIDTKQILNTIKNIFLEHKLLFPAWVLLVMGCGMSLVGIAFFITILSILFVQLDLLTSLLAGFLITGVLALTVGSLLIGKVFKEKE